MERIESQKIRSVNIAIDEFFIEAGIFELLEEYVSVRKISNSLSFGDFYKDGEYHEMELNKGIDYVMIDSKKFTFEEAMSYVDGSINPIRFAERRSGLDIYDYISSVAYEGGKWLLLDVKSKKELRGLPKTMYLEDLDQAEKARVIKKIEGRDADVVTL